MIEKYNKIVFCGIGGSAIPGEIVESLDLKIPVFLAREKLPKVADKNTLAFIVSYSGDTSETINLYKEARKRECGIIIITSGGKLGKLKKKEKVINVPKGYEPRDALPYLLSPVLSLLKIKVGNIPKVDKKQARKLALRMVDQLPVIYAGNEKLKSVSGRWQKDLNENSKVLAHSNYFPELGHNEIEADIEKNREYIFLIDKETKQIKQAGKILNPIKIKLKGKGLIEKIIYGMNFSSEVSKSLAEFRGKKWNEIPKITGLKK